jgi:hypothetical protein
MAKLMIIRTMLLTAVLMALGFCAATLPYIVFMYAVVSAYHSLTVVGPATLAALMIGALGAAATCQYAWWRHRPSLRWVLPFASGGLVFLACAWAQVPR